MTHLCHWPTCTISVPPAVWGCRPHWFSLPAEIRDRLWRNYRKGQEIDKRPSGGYLDAAKAAQAWIAEEIAAGRCI